MRFTSRGIGLSVSAPVLVAVGFAFQYAQLTVVGTAAVAAVLFGFAYVWWRPRLTVARAVDPDRVMRGESSTVTLTVGNTSRLRGATLIAHDRCGPASVPVPLLRLKAGATTTAAYPVPTARRGVVDIGPLRVVRRDPLGLLTLARGYGGVSKVWVYPTVHHLTAVPTGVMRSLDGRVDRVPHGSITFDTLREYVVGDELRHVHWRTTARVGELMVREHLDTSLPRLVVLLDDRLAAYPDADRSRDSAHFESACEAAASIVMAAFREELPVTLRLAGGAHAGGKDTRGYLDLLAEATLGAGDQLDSTVAQLRTRRVGDTLVYLTGPGGAADLGRVGTLRAAYPSLIAGAFGTADGEVPTALDGLQVLSAADGADFAAAWDGVGAW
ncbi:DUF58 domain-containing protein [Dactylosporangium sp. NBC_01737]|uniref:DUF58 domain-containing protein n=1 Tax=Dactylosporangium sp. NBC_01737 TaxID=2975959 RepID=UPI002E11E563|nr:DUF58 domain-containing protein [Dactylosporangium sp. NBC_01737]